MSRHSHTNFIWSIFMVSTGIVYICWAAPIGFPITFLWFPFETVWDFKIRSAKITWFSTCPEKHGFMRIGDLSFTNNYIHWTYSVTQLPVEFQWHWRLSSAEISVIKVITSIRFVILIIRFMRIGMFKVLMNDILAFDNRQFHWSSTGNWVTE